MFSLGSSYFVCLFQYQQQAAGHKALVPALIAELKRRGAGNMVVVCGGVIPAQDHQMLIDSGVTAIFGPGTRIVDAASTVLNAVIENGGGQQAK
jgi:methylmalonyl-CoA mutase